MKRDETNACNACKDPKVVGYWPGKCEAMQSPEGQVQ
jgi:hypothetical protein